MSIYHVQYTLDALQTESAPVMTNDFGWSWCAVFCRLSKKLPSAAAKNSGQKTADPFKADDKFELI